MGTYMLSCRIFLSQSIHINIIYQHYLLLLSVLLSVLIYYYKIYKYYHPYYQWIGNNI